MIDFMVWMQGFRSTFLNYIIEGITITAEESVILGLICLIFWCINKKTGYIAGLAVVFSGGINAALKELFKVPRPWTLDDRILPIRKETATSYSLPSGHTMTGAAFWSALMFVKKKKWFSILAIAIMLLVAFSRVYLSVHTPLDVIVGLILSIVIAFISYKAINLLISNKGTWLIYALSSVVLVLMLFFKTEAYYKMAGVTLSFLPGYILENKYIRFNVKTTFFKQILKILVGISIAFGLRLGLSLVLPELIIFDFIRYFLMGFSILFVSPWLFVKLKLSNRLS